MTASEPRSTLLYLPTDAYGGYGGIALYNRDVIEALVDSPDIGRVIAVPRVESGAVQPLPDRLVWDRTGLGGARAWLKAVYRQLDANRRIDLVYCAHINLAPVAWAIARLRRVPWVLAIYGIDAWPQNASTRNRFFARRADRVVSISQVTLDRFRSWCPVPLERCALLPNAIRSDQFGIAPRRADLVDRYGLAGCKVVMTFGRLNSTERYKGFDEIIAAMPEMLAVRPELRYVIAGSGDDRDRLEAKAKALGVGHAVIFTGMIDESEKADIYRLADVFALPSRGEGFGFVLLEAMACGIPVIASTLDGGREAVRDGALGATVHPDDRPALIAAILTAIDAPLTIPAGLAHFEFPAFADRVRAAIRPLLGQTQR